MNDDTISRQAAIDALIELSVQRDEWDSKEGFSQKRGIDAAICAIEDLPSAERRGRWTIESIHQYELAYGATAYEPVYKCSCCGLLTESYLRFDEPIMPDDADFPKWCPNCGAKMEGEEE